MKYLNAQITTQAIIKNSQDEILLLKRSELPRGKPRGIPMGKFFFQMGFHPRSKLRGIQPLENKPGGWFTLPGGTVHEKENITDALARELLEETGLKFKIGQPVWVWQSDHIGKDLVGIVFRIDKPLNVNVKMKISSEHTQYKWFSFKELMASSDVDPYIKKDYLISELKST